MGEAWKPGPTGGDERFGQGDPEYTPPPVPHSSTPMMNYNISGSGAYKSMPMYV